ncbi:MAG: hypothetical protein AB7U98_01345 [Candidatus Nitrosocosmicus sp.]
MTLPGFVAQEALIETKKYYQSKFNSTLPSFESDDIVPQQKWKCLLDCISDPTDPNDVEFCGMICGIP